MPMISISVDDPGWGKLAQEIRGTLGGKSRSTGRRVFKQWQVEYQRYLKKRFHRYSKGGGDWPEHSPGYTNATGLLLRDTEYMFRTLGESFGLINQGGNAVGVEIKFPRRRHPTAGMLVSKLAEIHHFGLGNMPQRTMWDDPDDQTKRKMQAHLSDWIRRAIHRNRNRKS